MADMEKQPLLAVQDCCNTQPEPTLADLQQNVRTARQAYWRKWSSTTSGKWHRRIMLGVTSLLVGFVLFAMTILAQDDFSDDGGARLKDDGRVPLEAHMMSKCPDAKDCLHDLVLPAMQQVSDKVDFRLSYIGSSTDRDDGVKCMHGPEECLGNIIELCAAKLYPDPIIYLGFTMCMTREYEKIPERNLIDDCALEHGIDTSKLNRCTVDEDGYLAVDSLRASFNRTAAAGVRKSCTVRLNNEVRCIRDGGKWTDCDGGHEVKDLVRDIEDLYEAAYY